MVILFLEEMENTESPGTTLKCNVFQRVACMWGMVVDRSASCMLEPCSNADVPSYRVFGLSPVSIKDSIQMDLPKEDLRDGTCYPRVR